MDGDHPEMCIYEIQVVKHINLSAIGRAGQYIFTQDKTTPAGPTPAWPLEERFLACRDFSGAFLPMSGPLVVCFACAVFVPPPCGAQARSGMGVRQCRRVLVRLVGPGLVRTNGERLFRLSVIARCLEAGGLWAAHLRISIYRFGI